MRRSGAVRRCLTGSLLPLAISGLSCAVLSGAPVTPASLPPVDAPPPGLAARPPPRTARLDAPESDADIALALQFLQGRRTGLARFEEQRLARSIVAEARRNQLEPRLVLAVIAVESAGNAFAVSPVGALGLMQVMPATGEELARRLGVAWRGPHELFDPFVNVQLGSAYLRELADRYAGDLAAALAAYNWGPGRIDRRLRRGTPLPVRYARLVLGIYDEDREEGRSS